MQTPTLAPFHLDRTYRQIYHVNHFLGVEATVQRSRHCCSSHPVFLGEILTKVRLGRQQGRAEGLRVLTV